MVFAGWRRDVGALLAAADALVLPSRVEPLGNVIIEAWSAGCPVVAAAVTGPRELIEDGVDGVLAPPEDAAALGAAIAGLLADPAWAPRSPPPGAPATRRSSPRRACWGCGDRFSGPSERERDTVPQREAAIALVTQREPYPPPSAAHRRDPPRCRDRRD